MSSLHQGFQATDQPADTEAIFGWLDRMNGSPLILQVKRQMLEVRPVGGRAVPAADPSGAARAAAGPAA
jgi:hypothetical protein